VAIVDILVPQMGEGLTDVRILEFHKKPGDRIRRDEILYSMETDKATMEVESPQEGVLVEWLAKEDEVLPIGSPVARFETAAPLQQTETKESLSAGNQETRKPEKEPSQHPTPEHLNTLTPELIIPPRTRAHCRQLGISEEEMHRIPASTGKLMPADVDAYLAARTTSPTKTQPVAATPVSADYTERPMPAQQRTFAYRIKRSAQVVIPGTVMRPIPWGILRKRVEFLRERDFTFRPTEFQTFAYCVAQAVIPFPKFRSTLIGDDTIREHHHLHLGIAVARSNGELVTAVVPQADTLPFEAFVQMAQERIQTARDGQDQADASTQFHLTYLGAYGIRDAVPVLVAPAIAVLFIGAAYEQNGQSLANVALTFDHRLINGVEAAEFLKAVVQKVEQVESITD
jgi:pyruvate/2-oxoglutarate dehydrogenase complex dihydrolipoamide acyltransferase (E2) component